MRKPAPKDYTPKGKPTPRYLAEQSSTKRERSLKQENRTARALGGRRQIASGALVLRPGDVYTDTHLLECKTTVRKSFSITRDLLIKIDSEAKGHGLRPGLVISFEEDLSNCPEDWVVLPLNELKKLMDLERT